MEMRRRHKTRCLQIKWHTLTQYVGCLGSVYTRTSRESEENSEHWPRLCTVHINTPAKNSNKERRKKNVRKIIVNSKHILSFPRPNGHRCTFHSMHTERQQTRIFYLLKGRISVQGKHFAPAGWPRLAVRQPLMVDMKTQHAPKILDKFQTFSSLGNPFIEFHFFLFGSYHHRVIYASKPNCPKKNPF